MPDLGASHTERRILGQSGVRPACSLSVAPLRSHSRIGLIGPEVEPSAPVRLASFAPLTPLLLAHAAGCVRASGNGSPRRHGERPRERRELALGVGRAAGGAGGAVPPFWAPPQKPLPPPAGGRREAPRAVSPA